MSVGRHVGKSSVVLTLAIFIEVALGAANAMQEGTSNVGFLAAWSTLPTASGWAASMLPSRQDWLPRTSLHRRSILAACFIVTALWVVGLAIGIASGSTNPDTAAHLGHYLWPPLLCVLGTMIYGMIFWASVVVKRLRGA